MRNGNGEGELPWRTVQLLTITLPSPLYACNYVENAAAFCQHGHRAAILPPPPLFLLFLSPCLLFSFLFSFFSLTISLFALVFGCFRFLGERKIEKKSGERWRKEIDVTRLRTSRVEAARGPVIGSYSERGFVKLKRAIVWTAFRVIWTVVLFEKIARLTSDLPRRDCSRRCTRELSSRCKLKLDVGSAGKSRTMELKILSRFASDKNFYMRDKFTFRERKTTWKNDIARKWRQVKMTRRKCSRFFTKSLHRSNERGGRICKKGHRTSGGRLRRKGEV